VLPLCCSSDADHDLVMSNGEVNLVLKENFKRLSVCDEFTKIRLKLHAQNLRFTTDRNSKPIAGIDSYHRHTSFSCTTYFYSEYIYVDLKRGCMK
jgi:hypothetical protein